MKTVVLGASNNPSRYSYAATLKLQSAGYEVIPVGIKEGDINGLSIRTDQSVVEGVDTVTLYIGPDRQPPLYDYVWSLNPRRIIFNPGTENPEFKRLAEDRGIETEYACTLVLLSLDNY